jgi:hypothetical protein
MKTPNSRSLSHLSPKQNKNNKLGGFSPQANYTDRQSDRHLSAKLVPTLADRGCLLVSATNPHGL